MSKNTKETAADETQEIRKLSESLMAEVRRLEAKLWKQEESLQQLSDAGLKQIEERFSKEIHTLETRLTALEELLESIHAQVQNGDIQIRTNAEQNLKAQDRISSEIESLSAELKEKKILLAAYEKTLWRSNGRKNFWQKIFERLNSP